MKDKRKQYKGKENKRNELRDIERMKNEKEEFMKENIEIIGEELCYYKAGNCC